MAVLDTLRAAPGEVGAAARAWLREKVPAAHRTRFDELLADARAVYRLREARDHYNDGWSTGLMRRALLEAGRRAVLRHGAAVSSYLAVVHIAVIAAVIAVAPSLGLPGRVTRTAPRNSPDQTET